MGKDKEDGGQSVAISLDVNRLLDQGGELLKSAKTNVSKDLMVGTMEIPKGVEPGKKTAKFVEVPFEFLFRTKADDDFKKYFNSKDDWTLRCKSVVSYNYVKYANLPQYYIEELHTRAVLNTNSIFGWNVSVKVAPKVSLSEQNEAPEGIILFTWTMEWGPHHAEHEVSFKIHADTCTAKLD